MAELHYEITGTSSQYEQALNQARQSTQQFTNDIEKSGKSIEDVFNRIKNAAAMATAGFGVQQFVKQVAQVRGEFQQLEMAFKTMLGSESQANALMQQMVQTAATTPFDLKGVAGGAKQLLAYGLEADKVNDTLIRLGDIAAGLSIPLNDIVYLYGTTMVQGRLYTQDLNQFTGRGIPLIQELAKQFNVADSEVKNLVTEGKVGFPEVQKAIESLTNEGGKFGGLMENQSQTIAGQKANLEDAIDMMFNEIGEKFDGQISDTIALVSSLVENWQSVAKAIVPVVTAIGSYKATMLIVNTAAKQQAAEQSSAHAKRIAELDEETAKLEEQAEKKRELLELDNGSTYSPISDKAKAASQSSNSETAAVGKKLAEQEAINASLDAEIVKRQQIAQQELAEATQRHADAATNLDIADQENIKAQEALSKAVERKNKADERVKSAQEYLDVIKETSEYEEGDSSDDTDAWAEMEAAIKEQAAAATELETASEEANTTEKKLNEAVTAEQTAATEVNTAQKRVNTLSTTQNTATQAANTTTENLGTAAKIKNTVATVANTVKTKLATTAQLLYRAAVQSATNAMKGLKAAIASNPLGFIITALTTAISLFYTFKDSTDEATEAEQRFGEEASKTLSNLNTLYAVVNSADKSSQTYKQSMKELTDICEQYGIQLNKEKDLLAQVNESRTTLNNLIAQEGVERQHANNIADIQKQYEEELKDIKTEIADILGDKNGINEKAAAGIITQNVQSNIDGLKAARDEYKLAQDAFSNDYGNRDLQLKRDKAYEDYLAILDKVTNATSDLIVKDGLAEEVSGRKRLQIRKQIMDMLGLEEATQQATAAENQAYTANKNAADSLYNLSGKEQTLAIKARAASRDVQTLASDIQDLVSEYGTNVLTIKLKYETDGVPQWMQDQLGIGKGKATQADLDEAKYRASYWENKLKYVKSKGAKALRIADSGETFTVENIANKAATYAAAAEIAQDEIDAQKKAKEEKDKNKPSKTPKSTGKSAAELQAEADKKIADENRKYDEQQEKERLKYQQQAAQTRIDQIVDTAEKEREQRRLDHEKALQDIKSEAEDIKKANVEHAKTLFEASPKNKDKDFYKSSDYTAANQLTPDQQTYIDNLTASENAKYSQEEDKTAKDKQQAATDAMRTYLKQYGSYQQQRLAIAEEYAAKIAKAETEGERLSLQAERRKTLTDLDSKHETSSTDWEQLFGDVSNKSQGQLQTIKSGLKAKLADGSLSVEDYKTVVEQIDKVNEALVNAQTSDSLFFGLATDHAKTRRKLELDVQEAIEQETVATDQLTAAQGRLLGARLQLTTRLQGMGLSQYATPSLSAADADTVIGAASKQFGEKSPEVEALRQAFADLADSTQDVTDAQGKLANATKNRKNKQDNKDNSDSEFSDKVAAFKESFDKVAQNISALPELTASLGIDADSDIGRAAQGLADTTNSASAALGDFASGNYIGAVSNGLNAVGSLLDGFGITGDSDKTLQSDIEKLTAQNEALQRAIEDLTDELSDASFSDSLDIYNKQVDYVNAAAKNTQEMMLRSANAYKSGMKGKHSSRSKVDSGMDSSDWQRISSITGQAVYDATAFFNLTSTEMRKVADEAPDLYAKIKELADDGYRDAAQYMDTYIEYGKQIDELSDSFKQKLTQTTFDDLRSNFHSTLMDMNADAEDFTDDFTKQLMNAVLEARLSDMLDDDLQAFYDKWAKLSENGLTSAEISDLQAQYQALAKRGLAIREEAAAITGYTGNSDTSQSSTYGSATTITQDQANEIGGRLTAMQVQGEVRNGYDQSIMTGVLQMVNFTTHLQDGVDNLQLLAIDRNAYLDDIAKLSKKSYEVLSSRLAKIEEYTQRI